MKGSALLMLEHSSSSEGAKATAGSLSDDYPTVGPDVISRESARMSRNFLPGGSIPLPTVSPFILHLLYRSCIILSSLPRESAMDNDNSLDTLQEALRFLTQRWVASGRTLRIVNTRVGNNTKNRGIFDSFICSQHYIRNIRNERFGENIDYVCETATGSLNKIYEAKAHIITRLLITLVGFNCYVTVRRL